MSAPVFRSNRVTRRVQAMLSGSYPMLSVRSSANRTLVTGDVAVADALGELAQFSLEIACDRFYPRSIPTVRETGGRIPVDLDRHVLPDGTFCLFHPEYYWQEGFHRKPLQALLDGPVRNFLIYQLCVEQGVEWPHGELKHGDDGALQFLDDMFGTQRAVTVRIVEAMAKGLTGRTPCPCGSRRATRNCHRVCLTLLDAPGADQRKRSLKGLAPRARRHSAPAASCVPGNLVDLTIKRRC